MPYAQTARLCLSGWITQLFTAVPVRSRATFVELLCGYLISPEGWVTCAICAIIRHKHWTTYYKLLERGSLRTLRIAHVLLEVVSMALPMETLNLVIDGTLKRFYDRKKSKTNNVVAIKVLAHKLARACFHMMKEKKPFDAERCFA